MKPSVNNPIVNEASERVGGRPRYAPLPAPSDFEPPRERLPDAPPDLAIRAVLWLRRALVRLADAIVPPEAAMFERITSGVQSSVLHAIARFGVVDALGDERVATDAL